MSRASLSRWWDTRRWMLDETCRIAKRWIVKLELFWIIKWTNSGIKKFWIILSRVGVYLVRTDRGWHYATNITFLHVKWRHFEVNFCFFFFFSQMLYTCFCSKFVCVKTHSTRRRHTVIFYVEWKIGWFSFVSKKLTLETKIVFLFHFQWIVFHDFLEGKSSQAALVTLKVVKLQNHLGFTSAFAFLLNPLSSWLTRTYSC